jgi:hypothetical protein
MSKIKKGKRSMSYPAEMISDTISNIYKDKKTKIWSLNIFHLFDPENSGD